ncbi:hypothetical protein TCELL_0133 [Thermogladius calderae 1633]|uniref:Uncharacterized protein n=1 Tax=Thermogladius calderae (strain DSM 22663 / VKM B-2946 / 1633) TaxID=1184251 RepID=I3TCS0_THEC1|nr:hypothetical protein [Thermogladius calderae]AFK50558.1 hypothetical protein TCELL_0133 [Thermogladius calderae 1633]
MPGGSLRLLLNILEYIGVVTLLVLPASFAYSFVIKSYLLAFQDDRVLPYVTGLEFTLALFLPIFLLLLPLYVAAREGALVPPVVIRIVRNTAFVFAPYTMYSLVGILLSAFGIRRLIDPVVSFFIVGVILSPILGFLVLAIFFLMPALSCFIVHYDGEVRWGAYRYLWSIVKSLWVRSLAGSLLALFASAIVGRALFLTLAPLFPSFFLEKVVSYTAYDWWIRGLLDKYILNYLSVVLGIPSTIVYSVIAIEVVRGKCRSVTAPSA